ncbi:hypothetical protein Tco_0376685, partial [Tanacetum coccineum]
KGQDLLRDGPKRASDGGGKDDASGDNGDGVGDGDGVAVYSTIAARVVRDK